MENLFPFRTFNTSDGGKKQLHGYYYFRQTHPFLIKSTSSCAYCIIMAIPTLMLSHSCRSLSLIKSRVSWLIQRNPLSCSTSPQSENGIPSLLCSSCSPRYLNQHFTQLKLLGLGCRSGCGWGFRSCIYWKWIVEWWDILVITVSARHGNAAMGILCQLQVWN